MLPRTNFEARRPHCQKMLVFNHLFRVGRILSESLDLARFSCLEGVRRLIESMELMNELDVHLV